MSGSRARLTLWGTILVLALGGFLVYFLVSHVEVIAPWLLDGSLVFGILLLLVLIGGCAYLFSLVRLAVQERTQALRLEREQHELERYLALTRVPADERGNKPSLIDIAEERVTQLPSGNFVQPVPTHFAPHTLYRSPKDLLPPPRIEEELHLPM